MRNCPMCEMSNTPACSRTALCSSTIPAYCTGISHPAKGTMRALRATCFSCRGLRFRDSASDTARQSAGRGRLVNLTPRKFPACRNHVHHTVMFRVSGFACRRPSARECRMSFVNSLENRFGRHAIPGLVTILAWFQVAVWILIKIRPGFESMLTLEPALVLTGQVWRLLTWVFIPTTDSPIWLIIAVWFMMMLSDTLDHAWGPFKVNLYIFGGVISMIIGAMFFHAPPAGLTLYTSIFLACAVIAPEYELLIFFILPVKMKWLAAFTGAGLLL